MAGFCLLSYTVWTLLMTLAVVHCATHGRLEDSESDHHHRSSDNHFLAATAPDPALSCAAYGKCCSGDDDECGPEVGSLFCSCDQGCHFWGDCCSDRDDFCHAQTKCEATFTNVHGKCTRYVGKKQYYKARKTCELFHATLAMPTTEQAWTYFVNSDFFKNTSAKWIGSDPTFDYWLNCIHVKKQWWWRTGKSRTGTLVSWNNFDARPTDYDKKAGLVCLGIGDGPWGFSKQWKYRHTFCEK